MARKNYSEEFRRDAVELYRLTEGATVAQIASDLGISPRLPCRPGSKPPVCRSGSREPHRGAARIRPKPPSKSCPAAGAGPELEVDIDEAEHRA